MSALALREPSVFGAQGCNLNPQPFQFRLRISADLVEKVLLGQASDFQPLRQGVPLSGDLDETIRPRVVGLYDFQCPRAISGRVGTLVVKALKRVQRAWLRPHVSVEGLERIAPVIGHRDAACTVVSVARNTLVEAPRFGRGPTPVLAGAASTVCQHPLAGLLVLPATAATLRPTFQRTSVDNADVAAGAPALPPRLASATSWRKNFDGQAAEDLTNQILRRACDPTSTAFLMLIQQVRLLNAQGSTARTGTLPGALSASRVQRQDGQAPEDAASQIVAGRAFRDGASARRSLPLHKGRVIHVTGPTARATTAPMSMPERRVNQSFDGQVSKPVPGKILNRQHKKTIPSMQHRRVA